LCRSILKVMILPRQARDKDRENSKKEAFCAGSILLFDYRLLHRGQAHTGDELRPLLYYTYGVFPTLCVSY